MSGLDNAARALGWRRGRWGDRIYHGLRRDFPGQLWVRIDGIRHGWVYLVDGAPLESALRSANEGLAEQQATHPYSFLPDDGIVPATVDGTKGHAWVVEKHGSTPPERGLDP